MADEDRIEVGATAERRLAPSRAAWTAAVVEEDADGRAAFDRCAQRQRALVAALESALGEDGIVVTPAVRLGARYGPSGALAGFAASASVVARCTLDTAPDVARVAIDAGADRLAGPGLEYADAAAAHADALVDAVAVARGKAERLADAAGRRLGRVLSVREEGHDGPPVARAVMRAGAAPEADAPEVRPDELVVTAAVRIAFELMS